MWKWIVRLVGIGLIGALGYAYIDYRKAGLHLRPEMPLGAFSISYRNGLRAILVDVPDERETRRYFGFPTELPLYEDAWSFCSSPKDDEQAEVDRWLVAQDQPGLRVDAVCRLDIDGEIVVRGLIATVPKL